MAKKWTDEEVQEEIKNAVKIVQEDREKSEYARLHERYGKATEGDPSGDSGDNGDGKKAPPAKEGKTEPSVETGGKRSLWWGDAVNE